MGTKQKIYIPVKNKLILLALIFANFMIVLDVSILPVALPTIQKLFHSSSEQLQWMVNSYLLTLTILVALSGKISDIFGHRKIFILSLVLFCVFSFLCAISQNSFHLIISRFLQGIGAALMISSITPLQIDCFPKNQRGKIMGIIASGGSLGFAIGPFVGGILTQYFSWQYIFLINVPISIIGIVIAFFAIPKSKKSYEKIDFKGTFSFMIAVSSITIALMQGKEWGWGSFSTLFLFFFFIFFSIILYISDKKAKYPFIDFSLFKNKIFLCALIAICVVSIVRMMTIFWVIYFQNVLDFSPTYSGTLLMISAIPMLFISVYAGRFVDKYGPRSSILTGLVALILSFLLIVCGLSIGNVVLLSISLFLLGIGLLFTLIASYNSGLSSISSNKRGIAGGVLNSFRNLSSSLGIAILGAIFLNAQFKIFSFSLKQNPDTKNFDPNIFEGLLSKSSKAIEAFTGVSTSIQNEIVTALKSSYTYGINLSNLISAFLIAGVLFIILYFFKPKKKKEKINLKEISKDHIFD
ncbi:MAG: Multidrug resistance protein Stp [Candidatus Anoxychlamydiales bacterium]|nr:Multidrug resistance protein Stp [Candidatus Anoxychlamydiales bacterium]